MKGLKSRYIILITSILSLGGANDLLLQRRDVQDFIGSYSKAINNRILNIYISNEGDVASVPTKALKSLWRDVVGSFSIRRVKTFDQLKEMIEADKDSFPLSIWFLNQPQDILFFSQNEHLIRRHKWLMFGDIRYILSQLQHPYLILDNQIMFANIFNASKRVELIEAYNIGPNTSIIVKSIGIWEAGSKAPLPINIKKSWTERRANLTGLHLRCTSLQQLPFLKLSDPDADQNVQIIGGYAGDVWKTLQETLGFTYTCRKPPDSKWGSENNGVWDGLVKEILDGNADVVVTSLDQNNARRRVIDFPTGIKDVGYQLVVRRPKLMQQTWTTFTTELLPGSWMATIGFVILIPFALSFCSNISPTETENISLKDAYILTLGAMAAQGSWLEIKSISTRIVFITIFLASLVVYAHYTSALVSLLTVASTKTRISGLADLLNSNYNFGFKEGISIQEEFESSTSGLFYEIWHKVILKDPDNLPSSNSDGVQKVNDENYIYMLEENIYKSEFYNACDTTMIQNKYFSKQTGFAFAKGSPLVDIINVQLIRMRDGGILDRLWERWQPPSALCTVARVVALDIFQLFTAFLLLLLGIIIGTVFLPIERLHWNIIGKEAAFKKRTTINVKASTEEHIANMFSKDTVSY